MTDLNPVHESPAPLCDFRKATLHEIEKEIILERLKENKGHKPKTAVSLGISLKTLYNKLNRYTQEQFRPVLANGNQQLHHDQ